MRIKKIISFSLLCLMAFSANLMAANYAKHPVALKWVNQMQKEGFSKQYLMKVLSSARRQNSILKAMNRQAEGRLSWEKYRARFVETKRIQNGSKFMSKHKKALQRAEKKFGVPAQMIVSIIGVETRYGKVTGNYRVLDAVATIAFDHKRRGKFFRNELKEFLLLSKEEKIDYTKPKGSFAGAMGLGQFIPSSFRKYAIDFDGDGRRDIWRNPTDAIGSIANYFAEHGWQQGEQVVVAVKAPKIISEDLYNNGLELKITLKEWAKKAVKGAEKFDQSSKATLMKLNYANKDQFWFGLNNFYVITRYNRSRYYAMAVYQLSQLIKAENKLS
jgi:membrane-bound lytic murein transglycosylase B